MAWTVLERMGTDTTAPTGISREVKYDSGPGSFERTRGMAEMIFMAYLYQDLAVSGMIDIHERYICHSRPCWSTKTLGHDRCEGCKKCGTESHRGLGAF